MSDKECNEKYAARRRRCYNNKNMNAVIERRERAAETLIKYPGHPVFNIKTFNDGMRTKIA
jgi:hypothetical protein